MTAEQFVEFLNFEQRDPRLNEILYPPSDARKAHSLINQFESCRSLAAKGKFKTSIEFEDQSLHTHG